MTRRSLGILNAVAATALCSASAVAQTTPSWLAVCAAIQPDAACRPENRAAIEQAIEHCRGASDKAACYRYELAPLPEAERAAPRPTILRGSRGQ